MSEVPCHHVLSLKFRSSVVSTSLSPMTSRSLAHARRLLRLINFDVLTIEPQIHAVANIGESLRGRSEEHTSELQSLMRISYAVFCLKKKTKIIYSTNLLIHIKVNKYKHL